MNKLPRPSERIVEIRERTMRKLLARYNLSTRTLEIRRRGRVHRIIIDEVLDTQSKIVYTRDTDE